jgi:hypothetical protein
MAVLRNLADTNTLVRLVKRHDPECSLVRGALRARARAERPPPLYARKPWRRSGRSPRVHPSAMAMGSRRWRPTAGRGALSAPSHYCQMVRRSTRVAALGRGPRGPWCAGL